MGSKSEVLLLDVTPLSLGIETLGGGLTRLIERNTTIPTQEDGDVLDGGGQPAGGDDQRLPGRERDRQESEQSAAGRVQPGGHPPAPRGEPQIEVTFDIDANGILNVSAKDKDTGKEAKIEIKGSSGLDPAEVERMRKEAEAHAAEDKKKVELIEARNQADQAVFQIEKLLREHGDKMQAADKEAIQAAIEKTRAGDARRGRAGDPPVHVGPGDGGPGVGGARPGRRHRAGRRGLPGRRPVAGGDGRGGPSSGGGKDDVIDAEFEVKK